jgi:hypothetical protein
MNKRLKIEVEQNDAGEVALLASAIMSQQNDEDKSRIIAVLTTATEPLTLMAASLGISNIDYVYDKRRDG